MKSVPPSAQFYEGVRAYLEDIGSEDINGELKRIINYSTKNTPEAKQIRNLMYSANLSPQEIASHLSSMTDKSMFWRDDLYSEPAQRGPTAQERDIVNAPYDPASTPSSIRPDLSKYLNKFKETDTGVAKSPDSKGYQPIQQNPNMMRELLQGLGNIKRDPLSSELGKPGPEVPGPKQYK
jgi:hypothetical protein